MDIVRDCLDKQLVDREHHKVGRVDGIVIEFAEGERPRVAYVEVGAVAQARRLHAALGRLVARVSRRWGAMGENPYRIPFEQVVAADINVFVEFDAEGTPALAWERVLRSKIIGRIPGA